MFAILFKGDGGERLTQAFAHSRHSHSISAIVIIIILLSLLCISQKNVNIAPSFWFLSELRSLRFACSVQSMPTVTFSGGANAQDGSPTSDIRRGSLIIRCKNGMWHVQQRKVLPCARRLERLRRRPQIMHNASPVGGASVSGSPLL